MNHTFRSIACLVAFTWLVFPAQGKAAQAGVYAANDLLMFFQNPSATGGTVGQADVVYFNLGSTFNVFRDAATPSSGAFGSTIYLGNINSILTSSYGADWTGLSSSIFFGANGQNGSTSAINTSTSNGDFARTVYITKARTSVGSVGQANSVSPLYAPSQTAVAGQIAGANAISGMTQPGVALSSGIGATLLSGYNPFFNGAPANAYSDVISGGLMNNISSTTTSLGSISNIVGALDLYRVAKTSGTGTTSASIWQNSNNITATYSNNFGVGGGGSAAAYYLGTITLSSNGDVNFVARQAEPEIALTGDDLTGMTTTQGVASAHKNLTIIATNLGTGDLKITMPDGFAVSTDNGANYARTATISPTNGAVNAMVRVRIAAAAPLGPLSGDVSVGAGSSTPVMKPISGMVRAPAPSVAIAGTLSGFVTTAGTASAAQNFSVSGSNLTGALIVTAPTGFELRRAGSGSYGSTANISPASGTVDSTSMEIRIAAGASVASLISDKITVASTGATSAALSVFGTVNAPPPSLTVSPMSISGLTATVGTASAPQTFTVSGVNLTSGVTVTAPAGFEVSNGGANYAGLLTLSPIDGTLENTTVSVRISDSANSGGINGTILIQSDAVEESVSVLGVVGSSAAFTVGSNFSAFTTTLGTPSAVQTFAVSGANLSGDVTVAAPSGFEVSIDGSSFSSSLALMPSNGAVSASISVRIAAATPVGSPSGNITVSSSGAQDIAVAMSGKVDPVPPALSTSGTLTSFTTTEGTASSVQAFTLSGSNLTGNVTVAAPSGFEVSNNGSSFSSSLALTPSSGTVSASISVRVASAAPSGSLSGNISVSAEGAASKTVSVNAMVTAMPRINVVGSLIPFDAISGTASAEQTLQLSGSNLTGNVNVTVPTRFEVSSGSGQLFASSLTINPISGSIVNQSIFVRLAAAPVGNYSGDLGFSTSSASAIKVAVSGTVVPPPTVNGVAKFVNFSSTQGSASASQSFSVSGANLTVPVTVTAPTGYEVSLDNSSFGSTQTINPRNGAVASQVYLRIAATTDVGSPSGTVRISSTGATERSLPVTGKVVPPPLLTLSGILPELTTRLGTASTGLIFSVSGSDLTGNVTVTAPAGFEVTGQSKPYARTIVLTPSQGRLDVPVTVRIGRTAALGNLSGNITVTSVGAAAKQTVAQGKVSAVPSLSLSGPIKAFNTTRGRPSASQSLLASGSALNSVVSVTAPAGFQVSLDNTNFLSRVQLNPANQTLTNRRIWIRLASGSNARSLSGNVTASSVGAPTKAIRINGRIR